jgi:hypothetical protein
LRKPQLPSKSNKLNTPGRTPSLFPPVQNKCAHGVGRTEAETLAGTAQTTSSVLMTCTLTALIEEAEVPAIARFVWSGLQIGAQ